MTASCCGEKKEVAVTIPTIVPPTAMAPTPPTTGIIAALAGKPTLVKPPTTKLSPVASPPNALPATPTAPFQRVDASPPIVLNTEDVAPLTALGMPPPTSIGPPVTTLKPPLDTAHPSVNTLWIG